MSDVGDKESPFVETRGELPTRAGAPSQASTMMPTNTTTQADVSCKGNFFSDGVIFSWMFKIACNCNDFASFTV